MIIAVCIVILIIWAIGASISNIRASGRQVGVDLGYIEQRRKDIVHMAYLKSISPEEYDRNHRSDYEQYGKYMGDYGVPDNEKWW